jgi:multisubunit Na+/H+ antiporter MnhB subunit
MTIDAAFDICLILLIVSVAVWSVVAREMFSAIVIFMIYGLLLSLAWVRLAAVDVALTEAAIGSGVTGMLLLNAHAGLRASRSAKAVSLPLKVAAGIFCTLISAGIAALVLFPTNDPVSLAPVAVANLPESGLGNPVAGVLFVYRSLDTLLEKVVLLLALLGVWSFAPDAAWGGVPGLRIPARPSGILVFLAQTLPPIGILVGLYMCWVGANEPGGAFQAGAILAAMWICVMIAGLRKVPSVRSQRMRFALVSGPLIFLVIGIAGIFLAGSFLAYPAGFAKPLIVVIEVALTLSIGATLGLLVGGPPKGAHQS